MRALFPIVVALCVVACTTGTRVGYFDTSIRPVVKAMDNKQRTPMPVIQPVKVYLKDNNVLLFKSGITITDLDSSFVLSGFCTTLTADGSLIGERTCYIASNEIVGATLYDFESSGAGDFATGFTGALGGFSWAMALICLSDPKSCFGSCPTVCVSGSDSTEMKAELFSWAISPSLIDDDADALAVVNSDTTLTITITNEALETHYIDKATLTAVDHPRGSKAWMRSDGAVVLTTSLERIHHATSSDGSDVTSKLSRRDVDVWRSGPEVLKQRSSSIPIDHIDLTLVAHSSDTIRAVCTWRNTLLSTTLLYEIMLGAQGIHALEWQQRLDTDTMYSALFKDLYTTFSGIRVEVFDKGAWHFITKLNDAGPINWRQDAIDVPTFGHDTVRLRLSFLADNVMIDHVGADIRPPRGTVVERPLPSLVTSTIPGVDVSWTQSAISTSDGSMLIHEPSSVTVLRVPVTPRDDLATVVIRSRGFYYGWVRSGWFANSHSPRIPDLTSPDSIIIELANTWLTSHKELERLFLLSRIPMKR